MSGRLGQPTPSAPEEPSADVSLSDLVIDKKTYAPPDPKLFNPQMEFSKLSVSLSEHLDKLRTATQRRLNVRLKASHRQALTYSCLPDVLPQTSASILFKQESHAEKTAQIALPAMSTVWADILTKSSYSSIAPIVSAPADLFPLVRAFYSFLREDLFHEWRLNLRRVQRRLSARGFDEQLLARYNARQAQVRRDLLGASQAVARVVVAAREAGVALPDVQISQAAVDIPEAELFPPGLRAPQFSALWEGPASIRLDDVAALVRFLASTPPTVVDEVVPRVRWASHVRRGELLRRAFLTTRAGLPDPACPYFSGAHHPLMHGAERDLLAELRFLARSFEIAKDPAALAEEFAFEVRRGYLQLMGRMEVLQAVRQRSEDAAGITHSLDKLRLDETVQLEDTPPMVVLPCPSAAVAPEFLKFFARAGEFPVIFEIEGAPSVALAEELHQAEREAAGSFRSAVPLSDGPFKAEQAILLRVYRFEVSRADRHVTMRLLAGRSESYCAGVFFDKTIDHKLPGNLLGALFLLRHGRAVALQHSIVAKVNYLLMLESNILLDVCTSPGLYAAARSPGPEASAPEGAAQYHHARGAGLCLDVLDATGQRVLYFETLDMLHTIEKEHLQIASLVVSLFELHEKAAPRGRLVDRGRLLLELLQSENELLEGKVCLAREIARAFLHARSPHEALGLARRLFLLIRKRPGIDLDTLRPLNFRLGYPFHLQARALRFRARLLATVMDAEEARAASAAKEYAQFRKGRTNPIFGAPREPFEAAAPAEPLVSVPGRSTALCDQAPALGGVVKLLEAVETAHSDLLASCIPRTQIERQRCEVFVAEAALDEARRVVAANENNAGQPFSSLPEPACDTAAAGGFGSPAFMEQILAEAIEHELGGAYTHVDVCPSNPEFAAAYNSSSIAPKAFSKARTRHRVFEGGSAAELMRDISLTPQDIVLESFKRGINVSGSDSERDARMNELVSAVSNAVSKSSSKHWSGFPHDALPIPLSVAVRLLNSAVAQRTLALALAETSALERVLNTQKATLGVSEDDTGQEEDEMGDFLMDQTAGKLGKDADVRYHARLAGRHSLGAWTPKSLRPIISRVCDDLEASPFVFSLSNRALFSRLADASADALSLQDSLQAAAFGQTAWVSLLSALAILHGRAVDEVLSAELEIESTLLGRGLEKTRQAVAARLAAREDSRAERYVLAPEKLRAFVDPVSQGAQTEGSAPAAGKFGLLWGVRVAGRARGLGPGSLWAPDAVLNTFAEVIQEEPKWLSQRRFAVEANMGQFVEHTAVLANAVFSIKSATSRRERKENDCVHLGVTLTKLAANYALKAQISCTAFSLRQELARLGEAHPYTLREPADRPQAIGEEGASPNIFFVAHPCATATICASSGPDASLAVLGPTLLVHISHLQIVRCLRLIGELEERPFGSAGSFKEVTRSVSHQLSEISRELSVLEQLPRAKALPEAGASQTHDEKALVHRLSYLLLRRDYYTLLLLHSLLGAREDFLAQKKLKLAITAHRLATVIAKGLGVPLEPSLMSELDALLADTRRPRLAIEKIRRQTAAGEVCLPHFVQLPFAAPSPFLPAAPVSAGGALFGRDLLVFYQDVLKGVRREPAAKGAPKASPAQQAVPERGMATFSAQPGHQLGSIAPPVPALSGVLDSYADWHVLRRGGTNCIQMASYPLGATQSRRPTFVPRGAPAPFYRDPSALLFPAMGAALLPGAAESSLFFPLGGIDRILLSFRGSAALTLANQAEEIELDIAEEIGTRRLHAADPIGTMGIRLDVLRTSLSLFRLRDAWRMHQRAVQRVPPARCWVRDFEAPEVSSEARCQGNLDFIPPLDEKFFQTSAAPLPLSALDDTDDMEDVLWARVRKSEFRRFKHEVITPSLMQPLEAADAVPDDDAAPVLRHRLRASIAQNTLVCLKRDSLALTVTFLDAFTRAVRGEGNFATASEPFFARLPWTTCVVAPKGSATATARHLSALVRDLLTSAHSAGKSRAGDTLLSISASELHGVLDGHVRRLLEEEALTQREADEAAGEATEFMRRAFLEESAALGARQIHFGGVLAEISRRVDYQTALRNCRLSYEHVRLLKAAASLSRSLERRERELEVAVCTAFEQQIEGLRAQLAATYARLATTQEEHDHVVSQALAAAKEDALEQFELPAAGAEVRGLQLESEISRELRIRQLEADLVDQRRMTRKARVFGALRLQTEHGKLQRELRGLGATSSKQVEGVWGLREELELREDVLRVQLLSVQNSLSEAELQAARLKRAKAPLRPVATRSRARTRQTPRARTSRAAADDEDKTRKKVNVPRLFKTLEAKELEATRLRNGIEEAKRHVAEVERTFRRRELALAKKLRDERRLKLEAVQKANELSKELDRRRFNTDVPVSGAASSRAAVSAMAALRPRLDPGVADLSASTRLPPLGRRARDSPFALPDLSPARSGRRAQSSLDS